MDPSELQQLLQTNPFAITAKYLFVFGILGLYLMCMFRQGMSYKNSALAIVGLKAVSGRDYVFNICHFGLIVVVLLLMLMALQDGTDQKVQANESVQSHTPADEFLDKSL